MLSPDNLKTLRFLRLINRPEKSRKCSLVWKKPCNKDCMTQQQSPFHSGINALIRWSMGCTNSSHSSCYFNVGSLGSPRTKLKALQKGLFWSAGPPPHWPVDCNQREVRALCCQPVNLKYIWLRWQWHCARAPLFVMWMLWFIQPGQLSQTNEVKTCKRLTVESKW